MKKRGARARAPSSSRTRAASEGKQRARPHLDVGGGPDDAGGCCIIGGMGAVTKGPPIGAVEGRAREVAGRRPRARGVDDARELVAEGEPRREGVAAEAELAEPLEAHGWRGAAHRVPFDVEVLERGEVQRTRQPARHVVEGEGENLDLREGCVVSAVGELDAGTARCRLCRSRRPPSRRWVLE